MTQQEINNASMLPVGTILRGLYRIDKHLSSGGFGNTYLATHIEFNERYAIKEFFMKGVTQRDDNQTTVSVSNSENKNTFLQQKEKFKKEARRLRQLDNPHIVKVHDLFDENGTAYYVMDYIDGVNLKERLTATDRAMTESEVKLILPQILDALKAVHDSGMWHLDLKPANIMLEKGGNIKLIDFGASKQVDAQRGGATASTAITYTNGYAPREQMEQNCEKFGPWTDLYALGATLYNLLNNKRPPLPTDIDDDISQDKHLALPMPADISKQMKQLVLWLMNTNRMQRPQTVSAIIHNEALDKTSNSAKTTSTIPVVDIKKEQNRVEDETTILNVAQKPNSKPTNTNQANIHANKSQQKQSSTTDEKSEISGAIIIPILLSILFVLLVVGVINSKTQQKANNTPIVENVTGIPVTTPIGNCRYTGPIDSEGKPHGEKGTAHFDDGRFYEGPFEHGILGGNYNAIFKYENGDTFEGQFMDNSFYYGTYTISKDKSHFTGYFNKGKPYNGKWFDKSGRLIETILP